MNVEEEEDNTMRLKMLWTNEDNVKVPIYLLLGGEDGTNSKKRGKEQEWGGYIS